MLSLNRWPIKSLLRARRSLTLIALIAGVTAVSVVPIASAQEAEPAAGENTTLPTQPADSGGQTGAGGSSTEESGDADSSRQKTQAEVDAEVRAELRAYEQKLRALADTYGAPPEAKPLGKQNDLWVDPQADRVYIDGYVALRRGPLEMLACPVGTKEHESIVAVFSQSSQVHAALLAIGAQTGTPVKFQPRYVPPTGQSIRVWVAWRDEAGKFQITDARKWIKNNQNNAHMRPNWVFAGSSFWTDPEDGKQYYTADSGDMICVSNFSTAMLDVPKQSSAEAANLLYVPFTDRIPEEGTPVRLVLVPQPIPTDKPTPKPKVDPSKPPAGSMLPEK